MFKPKMKSVMPGLAAVGSMNSQPASVTNPSPGRNPMNGRSEMNPLMKKKKKLNFSPMMK